MENRGAVACRMGEVGVSLPRGNKRIENNGNVLYDDARTAYNFTAVASFIETRERGNETFPCYRIG